MPQEILLFAKGKRISFFCDFFDIYFRIQHNKIVVRVEKKLKGGALIEAGNRKQVFLNHLCTFISLLFAKRY